MRAALHTLAAPQTQVTKKTHITKQALPAIPAALACLHRLNADEQGVAAVEFALLLPLLATLMLGIADLAQVAARKSQVHALAQEAAGAIAGLHSIPAAPARQDRGNGALSPTIARITLSAMSPALAESAYLPKIPIATLLSLPADAHASATLFWGCNASARLLSMQTPRCPDGTRAAAYAEIIVRAPVRRLVAWPHALLAREVVARAVVRVG